MDVVRLKHTPWKEKRVSHIFQPDRLWHFSFSMTVISKPFFPSQFNIIHINGTIFNFFHLFFQALIVYLYISGCVAIKGRSE